MEIRHLDSRGVYRIPSVSNYQQLIQKLIDASPSWEKDGGGIRGRTIAPLLGGSMGANVMEEAIPQQFNQQTNRSIEQQEERLPELSLPAMAEEEEVIAHPWKITIRTTPNSDPPTYQYAIESGSRLFNGFGENEVGVSGADGIFRNLEEGYYFIEVIFSDNIVDNAQIKTGTNLGNIIETSGDPPKQTKLRQQIGYVFFEDGVPQLRQNAWHNYTLFDVCRNGIPVKVTIAT